MYEIYDDCDQYPSPELPDRSMVLPVLYYVLFCLSLLGMFKKAWLKRKKITFFTYFNVHLHFTHLAETVRLQLDMCRRSVLHFFTGNNKKPERTTNNSNWFHRELHSSLGSPPVHKGEDYDGHMPPQPGRVWPYTGYIPAPLGLQFPEPCIMQTDYRSLSGGAFFLIFIIYNTKQWQIPHILIFKTQNWPDFV